MYTMYIHIYVYYILYLEYSSNGIYQWVHQISINTPWQTLVHSINANTLLLIQKSTTISTDTTTTPH